MVVYDDIILIFELLNNFITPGNSMVNFTDDTYPVIPASNRGSCVEEIQHVGDCMGMHTQITCD